MARRAFLAKRRPSLAARRAFWMAGRGRGLAGRGRPGYPRDMSLFAPKYFDAHPFNLDHVPALEQRVAALLKWEANLRSGRVHKAKEEAL